MAEHLSITQTGPHLTVTLAGNWKLEAQPPARDVIIAKLRSVSGVKSVSILDGGIYGWDTGLMLGLKAVSDWCGEAGCTCTIESLPDGADRLWKLALAVPERAGARRGVASRSYLHRLGERALAVSAGVHNALEFLGEATLSLGRLVTGRARFRQADLWLAIEQCGPQALGIVTTISVLVGAILAFVGAIQLRMFGAEVYVANLVGLGMVIEMGALMTGIILAGRTGAAFAAQLGTMQVNEEIDALKTMGIPPMDYLVLPRMLALMIMTPLLVVYADLLGIAGGALVGILLLDITPVQFFNQTIEMMTLWFCAQGLIKGSTFGVLVALAGCLRGMQCGRSASAVGDAATSAVVTSIVLLVLADAVWTFVFMVLG